MTMKLLTKYFKGLLNITASIEHVLHPPVCVNTYVFALYKDTAIIMVILLILIFSLDVSRFFFILFLFSRHLPYYHNIEKSIIQ